MAHQQFRNWRPPTFPNRNPPLVTWRPAVPRWEKMFCTSVGSVPWQKLVETKMYMYLHEKVMNWNDSACRETFDSAKRRYWAAINDLPCDISLPDPNMYIDNIDWNSSVDTELLMDLEKMFCTSVGSVPWRKLVETKKYMYLHEKVMNWDDSACRETFDSAKRRYWAAINDLPCDISLPDPNMYIDNIDWNSSVDPELLMDLEREPEVPSDEGKYDGLVILDSTYLLDQSVSCTGWGDTEEVAPNQTDLLSGAQFNQHGYYIASPWQQYCVTGEAANQYGWGNYGNDSWGWNQMPHYHHDWRNMSWNTPSYHHGYEYQMASGIIWGNLAYPPCVDNRANAWIPAGNNPRP